MRQRYVVCERRTGQRDIEYGQQRHRLAGDDVVRHLDIAVGLGDRAGHVRRDQCRQCGEWKCSVGEVVVGVPSFFQLAGTRTITATAIARKAPAVVTFTVDSGLLALNTSNSVLAPLLQSVGISPTLYVAAAQQLVGVNITPQGLLQALGVPVTGDVSVASLSGVAAVKNLTVGQLLSATNIALATQNGALSASVTAMNNLINVFAGSPVLNLPINLLGTATTPGLIANIDAAG